MFGAATSSYQVEGAHDLDGRGPSIWDTFCRTPGKVANAERADVACDHYHRWGEDIAIMQALSLGAYRFSIAWPRVLPTGIGPVPNEAGLAFYDRLVDGLLEADITPWATLYHWDLPQHLQDAGGWPDRRIVDHFVRYVDIVSRRLGDRVKHWITHNEPWCAAFLGHESGHHAPGHADFPEALRAAHHILLSHGKAIPVIRANAPGARVGITLNLTPGYPASPSNADQDATRHFDGFFNRWFLDPCHGRPYPTDMVADYQRMGRLPQGDIPFVRDGDIETIGAETDFLGINYYTRATLRSEAIPEGDNAPRTLHDAPDSERTDMGWEVYPDGLRDLLTRLDAEYPTGPIYITESGSAWPDTVDPDGRVRDPKRRAFLHDHLQSCLQAREAGVPVEGYFAWSLMDNFEWAHGYRMRFGLVRVDFETLERTIKDSGHWFARVAHERVLHPPESEE